MQHLTGFMKNLKNKVPAFEQNTDDIEGYFFEGADG
jgi:hypothetical protein